MQKQKTWFKMLDRISSFELTLCSKYKNNPKLEIAVNAIDELLEKFLYSMVRNISLEAILEVINALAHSISDFIFLFFL